MALCTCIFLPWTITARSEVFCSGAHTQHITANATLPVQHMVVNEQGNLWMWFRLLELEYEQMYTIHQPASQPASQPAIEYK